MAKLYKSGCLSEMRRHPDWAAVGALHNLNASFAIRSMLVSFTADGDRVSIASVIRPPPFFAVVFVHPI